MAIKPFEQYVLDAETDSLAERLVNFNMGAAADLARAIEAFIGSELNAINPLLGKDIQKKSRFRGSLSFQWVASHVFIILM